MAHLKLYTSTFCPFCEKVKKVIEEKNIDAVEIVNIDKEPAAREELIEKGGKKQVPCLFIDGEPLYESLEIIKYLEEHC